MSKHVLRLCPYSGFDIPALEQWLAARAARGLRFSMTAGPFCYFEKAAPESVRIHLEPIRASVQDDPELNELYQKAGWHYQGIFRGSYYVYAASEPLTEAHTDAETLYYALGRFVKHKQIAGVLLLLANLLLAGLYHRGAPWVIGAEQLRYFPLETLSNGTTLPFLLSLAGLLLIDLAYAIGLLQLIRYRRSVRSGVSVRKRKGAGWLQAAGLLILLPVLINSVQLFLRQDYRPFALADSGFVTMTDIEGETFAPTGDRLFNMDYIAHEKTLLKPESWYFRQYAAKRQDQSYDEVPHLTLRVIRYPLESLAHKQIEEWSRQQISGTAYVPYDVADECLYAVREAFTHTGELTGEIHTELPGGILVLRLGNTVLLADYYGEQDLMNHAKSFVQMLRTLS